ncbi:MAG: hypothetical protein ACRCU0_03780 [Candidatus Rhabdochlamydia sp.]
MSIYADSFFDAQMTTTTVTLPFKIAPCPLHRAITCHLLQLLIRKVQEKAFVYLFPSAYSEDIYNQNLTQYGASAANRGRNEYKKNFSNSFKIANNALASAMTLLLLKAVGWNGLNKFIRFHYLFVVKISLLQIVVKIIAFILQRLQQKTYLFFHSIHVPKPNYLAKKKGQEIRALLAKLQELHLLEELEDRPGTIIDWITTTIPLYPIKEKNNPLHFWDIKTLENLCKNPPTNCPNGCGKKLELEDAVSTDLQDEIIKQLEEAYNKYDLSSFKEQIK